MCIAQTSNPATNLSWYINGEPVRYPSSMEKAMSILDVLQNFGLLVYTHTYIRTREEKHATDKSKKGSNKGKTV